MDPTLKVGGIVAAQPVNPQAIEVGDIITYYSPQLGKTIVHRVIEKHMDNELHASRESYAGSGLYFITQGDANSAPDSELVPAQNVVGKVSAHVPLLGYVSQFAKTPFGSVLFLALPGAMIVATEIKNIRDELSRLMKGRKAAGAAEALATVRPWTTGLRTEDWMSWGPAADSHI